MTYKEEDLVKCHLEAVLELYKENKVIPFSSLEHMEFFVGLIPYEDIPLYINIKPAFIQSSADLIFIVKERLTALGLSFEEYWKYLLREALNGP